jgi:DNA-binding CsgD family transcriptional regulator
VLATFERATTKDMPWATGELGWHLVRHHVIDPGDARLAASAAPYRELHESRWAEAARLWNELGCPYEASLALLETENPSALTTALHTFDALGARPHADRAAARLRGLGERVPRRPRRSSHPQGLTAREVEVLDLLRYGLTDREIAQRLSISVKTAGHHVSSILAKLGVTSRRQATT